MTLVPEILTATCLDLEHKLDPFDAMVVAVTAEFVVVAALVEAFVVAASEELFAAAASA